jgi:hypothetical protein
MAYGDNMGNPGEAGGSVGDWGGDIDGGNYTNINAQHQRERARRSATDVAALVEAMNTAEFTNFDRRTQQRQLEDMTLQQAKGPPMTNMMDPRAFDTNTNWNDVTFDEISRRTPSLDLTQVDIDPWAGNMTPDLYNDTENLNSIAAMLQKAGLNQLSPAAKMMPGVSGITSLLNSINLHDITPLLTEEEIAWDDDRWEGSVGDPYRRKPRNIAELVGNA